MSKTTAKKFVTAREAGDMLGITQQYVLRLMRRYGLPLETLGGTKRYLIHTKDVERLDRLHRKYQESQVFKRKNKQAK